MGRFHHSSVLCISRLVRRHGNFCRGSVINAVGHPTDNCGGALSKLRSTERSSVRYPFRPLRADYELTVARQNWGRAPASNALVRFRGETVSKWAETGVPFTRLVEVSTL